MRINISSADADILADGEPIGKGNIQVKLGVGTHTIEARTEKETRSAQVQIFENDVTSASFEFDEDELRVIRFYVGVDASWMLGKYAEFGPSHIAGIEIRDKYLMALNFYWGLQFTNSYLFGGGFNYLYTFNAHDIFIARFGGVGGFWMEETIVSDSDDGNSIFYDYFFGGPKFRLEVGYKHVYLTIVDATLLLGSTVKALLNCGLSFRF